MVLNLMIGQVTPPSGVCLFVIADIEKMNRDRLYKANLPFIIPLILVLFMCTCIPGIVTWLPSVLTGAK
jgi:TRAP-type C4-dicarboxylate transport system permease large subunit